MNSTTPDKETFFAKAMIAVMLAAITVSSLVLGVVAVVAMNDSSESASGASDGASVVQVHLTEFAISMVPDTVPPGDVVFQVMNHGSVEHNFSLPSTGAKTAMLKPGEGEDLAVSGLEAGDVGVLCEVAGHDAAGMKGVLHVVEGAAAAAAGDSSGAAMSMSWQQMDKMMEEVALKFPAKTQGVGNEELEYSTSADGYKVFNLVAKIVPWEVEPGKFVDGWSYNGLIPGPVIRVNVGDKVRLVLKNELPESTALHLHGIRVPNSMDGVDPYTQKAIIPGGEYVYEFTALEPSVGMYHSHHNAQVQVPNGLAGALLIGDWKSLAMKAAGSRVADADGDAEQEVVMVLNDSGTIGLSLNGKSFPATSPYALKVGETMVVHYFNEGNMTHPMHLHQPAGLVVAHDGKVLENPFWADTLNVAPGERWTVVYTALDPGVWAWHCHILTHAETAEGMRYMVTALIVS
ncbi:MAG: multicopper oxidase domain-containing protein [Ilumatobacteraceae bacterium]